MKKIILDKIVYVGAIALIAFSSWLFNLGSRVSSLEAARINSDIKLNEIEVDTKIIRCMNKDHFACESLKAREK